MFEAFEEHIDPPKVTCKNLVGRLPVIVRVATIRALLVELPMHHKVRNLLQL